MVISIKPMVLGSLKKRTLMYPNTAARATRMVMIKKYENIADAINKIGFGLVIYTLAVKKQESHS